MKKIFTIAWKDILGTLTNRFELIFFLLLPVLFTVVTGVGLGGNGSGSQDAASDNRFEVLVVDLDQSSLSSELIDSIGASIVIRPTEKTAGEAAALFKDQKASAVLTIPAGFEAAVMAASPVELQLQELPNASQALAVEQAVKAVTEQLSGAVSAAHASTDQAILVRPFQSEAEKAQYFDQSLTLARTLTSQPSASVKVTQAATIQPKSVNAFEQASAGQMVTWTLITMIGAAEVFVDERLGGTLSRLITTPTKKGTIVTGKISGRLILGLIQMTLLIAFGALVLKVNWGRSWAALIVMVIAFALAAVSLGVMAGTFMKTRSQAGWVVVMISMVTSALGGAWWPLEVTPPTYQAVVRVLPTTWAMTGFTDVIVRGQGVAGILPEAGVLLAFAIVFLLIGVRRLKFE